MMGRCIDAGRMVNGWYLIGMGWYSGLMGNQGGGSICTGCWLGRGALCNDSIATVLLDMVKSWSSTVS